jgi:hypothetical protein
MMAKERKTLHTSAQAAAELGSTARTVNRWALLKGIGEVVGVQRLFTAADIRTLRGLVRHSRGNPLMGKKQPVEWTEAARKKNSE